MGIFHHSTLADTKAAYAAAFADGPSFEHWFPRYAEHGDFARWQQALEQLPPLVPDRVALGGHLQLEGTLTSNDRKRMLDALAELKPWRKGPWDFFGTQLTTEWRSDWKWQRLAPHLPALQGQKILDVGSGNGYFGWQLLHGGAAWVLGVDPTILFCLQHLAVNRYLRSDQHWVVPMGFEELPPMQFDGVLSLGVVYHRRDPQAHVDQLFAYTKPGGWLALETLSVDAAQSLNPAPEARYARMRNVWCVPNHHQILNWLGNAGFDELNLVDCTTTSVQEQRSTPWMTFESLAAALDPEDSSRTVEGFPAPQRTIVMARRPSR